MPPKKCNQVHLVLEVEANGHYTQVVAAYNTAEEAEIRAQSLKDEDDGDFETMSVDIETAPVKKTAKAAGKVPAKAKAAPKKAAKKESGDEDDEDDDEEETKPAKTTKKKAVNEKRKQVAGETSDALEGVKLFFTGTFEMDRKTCEATVVNHGGTTVSTMKQADFIVLGTKPGPKKVDEINDKGYETWSEAEFLEKIGATGVKKQKNDD